MSYAVCYVTIIVSMRKVVESYINSVDLLSQENKANISNLGQQIAVVWCNIHTHAHDICSF